MNVSYNVSENQMQGKIAESRSCFKTITTILSKRKTKKPSFQNYIQIEQTSLWRSFHNLQVYEKGLFILCRTFGGAAGNKKAYWALKGSDALLWDHGLK